MAMAFQKIRLVIMFPGSIGGCRIGVLGLESNTNLLVIFLKDDDAGSRESTMQLVIGRRINRTAPFKIEDQRRR